MQVSDIINYAVAKVGLAQEDAVPNALYNLCLKILNRVYEDIWNLYPFRDEKIVSLAVTLTASESTVTLPETVDAIRAARLSNLALFPVGEIMLSNFYPEAFSEEGLQPTHWINLPDVPVHTQPATASLISIKSSSTSDTSGTVRIFGIVSGLETYEDLSLNGTTLVNSTASFSELLAISKPLTTGRITVQDATTTELAKIAPWQYKGSYRKIQLYPVPTETYTAYIEGLHRFPRITSDYDTILISKAEASIIDQLVAELLEYDGRAEEAAGKRALAVERFNIAINAEEQRDSSDNTSYPVGGLFGDEYSVKNSNYKTF